MSLARDLESRLQQLGAAADGRVLPGAVHPAEIAALLTRESGLACRPGPTGPLAPNRFAVRLPADGPPPLPATRAVSRALEQAVEETARERGWRLAGPARVRMESDPSLAPETVKVESAVRPGRRPPWAVLRRAGRQLPLTVNRCLIGRGGGADLAIDHPSVSNDHALLWQEGGGVWAEDRASAGGTFVNGQRITGRAEIPPGGKISFGVLEYRLERR